MEELSVVWLAPEVVEVPAESLKRSSSSAVFMERRLELSWLMIVLAMLILNFCSLYGHKSREVCLHVNQQLMLYRE